MMPPTPHNQTMLGALWIQETTFHGAFDLYFWTSGNFPTASSHWCSWVGEKLSFLWSISFVAIWEVSMGVTIPHDLSHRISFFYKGKFSVSPHSLESPFSVSWCSFQWWRYKKNGISFQFWQVCLSAATLSDVANIPACLPSFSGVLVQTFMGMVTFF